MTYIQMTQKDKPLGSERYETQKIRKHYSKIMAILDIIQWQRKYHKFENVSKCRVSKTSKYFAALNGRPKYNENGELVNMKDFEDHVLWIEKMKDSES